MKRYALPGEAVNLAINSYWYTGPWYQWEVGPYGWVRAVEVKP